MYLKVITEDKDVFLGEYTKVERSSARSGNYNTVETIDYTDGFTSTCLYLYCLNSNNEWEEIIVPTHYSVFLLSNRGVTIERLQRGKV